MDSSKSLERQLRYANPIDYRHEPSVGQHESKHNRGLGPYETHHYSHNASGYQPSPYESLERDPTFQDNHKYIGLKVTKEQPGRHTQSLTTISESLDYRSQRQYKYKYAEIPEPPPVQRVASATISDSLGRPMYKYLEIPELPLNSITENYAHSRALSFQRMHYEYAQE